MSYADDVKEFMQTARQDVPSEPTVLDGAEKWSRLSMIIEEFSEHKQALAALKKASEYNDTPGIEEAMVELGDSIIDMIFVLIGTAFAYGLDPDDMWEEVARSNRSKVNPGTGFMDKDSTGKVTKPQTYSPPNLRRVIYGRGY